jgi:hypothetical protein
VRPRTARVGIATCEAMPEGYEGDAPLLAAIRAAGAEPEIEVWSDPEVDWEGFDLVLLRSVWDYTFRRDEFVAWAERVGGRLRNPPALVRWNSDKRYLAELAAAGLPVVPTSAVEPGAPAPPLEGEVVVKPAISAGGRDTGRFGRAAHGEARALIARICDRGETALVQPYQAEVDRAGETAVVFFAGRPSHVLRKGPVLAPDEVAPMTDGPLPVAEVMWDPALVGRGQAGPADFETAGAVIEEVARRFGAAPLYARVDMVPGPDGSPILMELEAIEPNFYFETAPGAAERLAAALLANA